MKKAFHSFQEYLTHKGKVQDKPSVEKIPDYSGPKPKSPGKATTKGKGWEVPNVGKKGTPAAYKNGTDKAPKKAEKGGFGDMGDKSLIYNPDPKDGWYGGKDGVSKSSNGVTGGKETKTWPKGGSTTESFLASTKGMNTSQFAKHIKKSMTENTGNKKAPHVVAYAAGAFHPDPIQAIRYVSYLANENVNLRRALVREMNRAGCSKELLQELLQLPESFGTLAGIITSEHGEIFSRRLDKAIREAKVNEEVDEPAHDDDNLDADSDGDGDDPSEEDLDDEGNPKKKGDDLDLDGDDDGAGDGDDLDIHGDDDEDGPPPPPDGDMDGDEDGPPPPPDGDMGGDAPGGMGDDDDDLHLGGDDMGGDEPPDPTAGKKPGKPNFGDMGDDDMGDDDGGKIDFGGGDDDDLGDKDDIGGGDDPDGDLGDDDDGLGDDDDMDDDDLGDDEDDGLGDEDEDEDDSPHSFRKHLKKKKMPWEDEM